MNLNYGIKSLALSLVFLVCSSQAAQTPPSCKRDDIANVARFYIGSKKWSKASTYGPGKGARKEGWFIRDILREAGATVPNLPGSSAPLEGAQWKNPGYSALVNDPHWQLLTGVPGLGDVVAGGKNHVAIIIDEGREEYIMENGKRKTMLFMDNIITNRYWQTAQAKTKAGIARTRFGFAPGTLNSMLYWRYVC